MEKKNKQKGTYQDKLTWDARSFGEMSQQIGKKMTQKTHKTKLDYTRKPKYKKNWLNNSDEDF
jgi:hypothetical protein